MDNCHYFALMPDPMGTSGTFRIVESDLDLGRRLLVEPPGNLLHYEINLESAFEPCQVVPPPNLCEAGDGDLLMSERMVRYLEGIGAKNFQSFPGETVLSRTRKTLEHYAINIVGVLNTLIIEAADHDTHAELFITLQLRHKQDTPFDLLLPSDLPDIIIQTKLDGCCQ